MRLLLDGLINRPHPAGRYHALNVVTTDSLTDEALKVIDSVKEAILKYVKAFRLENLTSVLSKSAGVSD